MFVLCYQNLITMITLHIENKDLMIQRLKLKTLLISYQVFS